MSTEVLPMRPRFGVLLLAFVASGLAATGGTAQSTQTTTKRAALHLGSTPWSPLTNAAGKPRYAIDLVEAALQRMGISAETAIVPEGTLTAALLEGRFDGSPALWRDPEREAKLVYSKPYLENRLVLVARHGDDVSAPALPALAGKRIALVDGYAYGDALQVQRGPTYVAASTVEQSLEKVLSRDADYALMDELVVQYLVTNYPEEVKTRLAIGTEPLLVRTLHFALRRTVPGAESIVAQFDAEMTKMIADRSYQLLLRVGWLEADVDGDGRTELVPASDQAGQSPPVRRYEHVTVAASKPKPEAPKRFFLGGQVYEGWTNVPDRYKVMDLNRTPLGTQIVPMFTFKW
jgi:polar amino acid transport system substrate-binding protein